MLRPSYNQLIQKVNEGTPDGEPVVTSRYSIVLAAAKRARQIVDGNTPHVEGDVRKPLSVAVAELNAGEVRILPEGSEDWQEPEASAEEEAAGAEETDGEEVSAQSEEEPAGENSGEEETDLPDSGEAFAAEPTEKTEV